MTIKEQIKILDNKIKQNQADCDLYKQNAKISTSSSGQLDKNAFIEYSNTMDDIYIYIYDDIEDYDKKRKRKVLIIFRYYINNSSKDIVLCFK